jgi:2'-5' RNA ligase
MDAALERGEALGLVAWSFLPLIVAHFQPAQPIGGYMHRYLKVLAALTVGLLASLPGNLQPLRAGEPNPVTAIDIMLEPDATMIEHAKAANQRLVKGFPFGFALDERHHPHITCLQQYVETANLDKLYEAVGKVVAEETPTSWELRAYKYYYIPWKNIGIAGIVIEPTDDLIRFQKKLIDAVAPFAKKTGTAAAFVTTAEDPDINQPTIDYVTTYVSDHTGKNFNPHVTIGIATQDYLKKLLDEKFEAFTFSPTGVSVYQLGNLGAAQKKLKSWG